MPRPTSSSQLTATVLGGFRMTDRSGKEITLRSTKAQILVAMLLFAPRRQLERSSIVKVLWGDNEPGRASLRQILHMIRRTLPISPEILKVDRDNIAISMNLVSFDLDTEIEFHLDHGIDVPRLLDGIEVDREDVVDWLESKRRMVVERVDKLREQRR